MKALPTVIVLAAGRGERFEGPGHKLEQHLGECTVLGHTLAHALATQLPVLVVTTSALAPLASRHVAARDVLVLSAGTRPQGMGVSIAAGVSARANAGGWVVLPGDMPLVRPATIRAVAKGLAEHAVVYAQYKGRRGHPVAFGSELCSELMGLSGDEGARRVVARFPAHGLEVDDSGVVMDLDTLADLAVVRERLAASAL